MAFSFVHAADLHLDCPFDGLGDVPEELAASLKSPTLAAFENIITLCLERQVDFLLIAGDVYNAEDKSLRAQLAFRTGLARLADAGVPSYVAFGNHDPTGGWSAALDWPELVHCFPSGKPKTHSVLRSGQEIARVSGMSFARRAVTDNLAERCTADEDAPFSIAVLHCNCGQVAAHDPYAPCTLSDLEKKRFDYWALGHIHKGEVLRERDPAVVYPGNPQGLNPKETGAKGCYLVKVDDSGGLDLEFVETDAVRWFAEEVDASGMDTEQQLINALDERVAHISECAGRPALVRFRIAGRTALHRSLARSGILDDMADSLREDQGLSEDFVWVESVRDDTKPDVDLNERRKAGDFVGDFLRAIEEARNDAERLDELRTALKPVLEDRSVRKALSEPSEAQIRAWLDEAEVLGVDALLGEEG